MKDMIHTDNKVKEVSVALSTAYSKGLLKSDKRVLLTGCDIDGLPRGKTVMLEKIEKSMDDGFGKPIDHHSNDPTLSGVRKTESIYTLITDRILWSAVWMGPTRCFS